jgi:hypothetical protein
MGFLSGGKSSSNSSSTTNNIDNKQIVDGGSSFIGASGNSSLNYTINNADAENIIKTSLDFALDFSKQNNDLVLDNLKENQQGQQTLLTTISDLKNESTATRKLLDQLPLLLAGVGLIIFFIKR